MSVARKPQRATDSPAPVDIEALINRGGSPSGTPAPEEQTKSTPILLRIPPDLLAQLEATLKARPVRLPRHTWILEAIHEKLTRETKQGAL